MMHAIRTSFSPDLRAEIRVVSASKRKLIEDDIRVIAGKKLGEDTDLS